MEVKRYQFGKSICIIDDSSLKYKSREEVQPILDRIAKICYQDSIRSQNKKNK